MGLGDFVVLQSVTVPGVQPKLSLGWIQDEINDDHKGRLTILSALDGPSSLFSLS